MTKDNTILVRMGDNQVTNAEQFHYSDFTEKNYERLLNIAIKNYDLILYSDFDKPGRNLLWRHDVDYSIHRALALARIEHALGIKSTYFIYAHSPIYNVLELDATKKVKEIAALGHSLGLHADNGFYAGLIGEDADMVHYIDMEKKQLESLFDCQLDAVSFHQPGYRNMQGIKDDYYAGMINVYSTSIFNRYEYCSDSNGFWRFRRLEDVLQDESIEALQVLTHPTWWVPEALSPAARIKRAIDGRADYNWNLYCHELEECDRLNVGVEELP